MNRLFGATGNQFGVLNSKVGKPPSPTPITSLAVGEPTGQKPNVLVRDFTNSYDLYAIDADIVFHYPGSTTKFMTLLLMWEYKGSVWDTEALTVTSDDVTQPYTAQSITVTFAGLEAGDILNWEDLAYCVVLPSGGDACQAAARIIGDMIYAAAGSTGTQGNTRFVETMNARAAAFGMTNATYFDSLGGSLADGIERNTISTRDLSTIASKCFGIPALTTILGTTSHGANIVGINARTLALTNVIPFMNGPQVSPAGVKDTNVLGAKTGEWIVSGVSAESISLLYATPSGIKVLITLMGSHTGYSITLDVRGIMYQLLRDFPYLYRKQSTDAAGFSNVKLLVGGDGSIVDESASPHTLSNTSVTSTTGLVGGSTGSMLINDVNDDLHCADASDLIIGSGDFTIECFYAGPGTPPGTNVEYVFFIKTGSNQREFALNYFNGAFNLFASSDGQNWTTAVAFTPADSDAAVFFNGAVRHIAFVKSGTAWHMYLNGEKFATGITVGTIFDGTGSLSISIAGSALIGTIDEFRATYGVARYTAAMVTITPSKFPRA